MKRLLSTVALGVFVSLPGWWLSAAENPVGNPAAATRAINILGLELLTKATDAEANALLSPYSIQTALAMAYAGAAGQTRAEMAKVLHYPADESRLHESFAALRTALEAVAQRTADRAERARQYGGPSEPIVLTVASRLFGQESDTFRAPFLSLLESNYRAPFQSMDFIGNPRAAIQQINGWVEQQTQQRIRNLVPPDGLDSDTRLVLVNAIYLKAPWADEFSVHATQPAPFHVKGGPARKVPTMVQRRDFGYAQRDGFRVVTVPYTGAEVQLLILLPDKTNGLAALEAAVTPELLGSCANLTHADVLLHLPKFKIQPPSIPLGKALQALGMKSAFDQPPGSANFDRMAPRKRDDYLSIAEVFHKTFLNLDEKGTEAAAATAVMMMPGSAMPGPKPTPIEMRVDHPFLFAIQYRPSGACLFLGRVTNPQ